MGFCNGSCRLQRILKYNHIRTVCGKGYKSTYPSEAYCSPECRKKGLAEYHKKYEAARRGTRKEYQAARYAALTKAQREEVNRRARENYAKRKERKNENKKN